MKCSFDPLGKLILITVEVHGINKTVSAKLALDTGATTTCIAPEVLFAAGIDPLSVAGVRELATGNGYVKVGLVRVTALRSLGKTVSDMLVVCHNLPSRAGVQGLLGLDFLRTFGLHIDFRNGTIELS